LVPLGHLGGVMKTKNTTTEALFDSILSSSLCRIDGPKIDLLETIRDLCDSICDEEETDWNLGEFQEFDLASFLVGAYWSLTEWHGGQETETYATLCSIGEVFSPGMTSGPEGDSEQSAFDLVSAYISDK